MAPTNSPMKYLIASPPSMPPVIQMPTVTAGLRCAPLNWPTTYTATMTAMPHPKVITIHPEFWALEWFNSTAATTPSPRRIRIAVPIISAPMMLNETPLLERETWDPGATLGRPYSRGIAQVNARVPAVTGGWGLVRGRTSDAASNPAAASGQRPDGPGRGRRSGVGGRA